VRNRGRAGKKPTAREGRTSETERESDLVHLMPPRQRHEDCLPRRGAQRASEICSRRVARARNCYSPAPPICRAGPAIRERRAELSPLISSAKTVTILNCAAQKVGQFAGYDDFRTRIDISNEPHIANITRYNGNLLSLLGIHFERIEPATATEPSIYISESFWNEAFGRSENILGTLLKLHATNYRVCGVTRGTSALVPQTDIWLPVSGRGACGAMACMRIVGALEPRTDWRTAQRELLSCFEKFLQDQPYNGISGTRMLPMEPGIYFRDYLPMVAASSHRWRQRAWSRT
jgi:hypothetical protein